MLVKVERNSKNPILTPDENQFWEADATFNGSIVRGNGIYHFVYRASSFPHFYFDKEISLSTVGYAESSDGVTFSKRRPLITPENPWEQFGCEDPRVTKLNGKYYIFYTALSNFPPAPKDIKIGVAITDNFEKIKEKHLVTDFNSKAMALFPDKINGKIASVLSVNTDIPPTKIALAFFDKPEQIWNREYWHDWLSSLSKNIIQIEVGEHDHIEVGAQPVKTDKGWLLVYSYIKNYLKPPATFSVEAVLLDLENPHKIIGKTKEPLLIPSQEYELYGKVPNIVFPSGALIKNKKLYIYYGAADTTCGVAECFLDELLTSMTSKGTALPKKVRLKRYEKNPIITADKENSWESREVLNPAAIYEAGKVLMLYRAIGEDNTSVLGYASSKDGFNFERLNKPAYIPREDFEKKASPELHSGCEDPRLTKMGNKVYMLYTGYDGKSPTKVVLTSIPLNDFAAKKWSWDKPKIISHPERSNKNACLLSEKVDDQYVFFHRIGHCVWIDFIESLEFGNGEFLGGKIILWPRRGKWDNHKVGIAGPPIKTSKGWLLIYHGLSLDDKKYRLGAALLDLKNPDKILNQLDHPILEPEVKYEKEGFRPDTVFSCGAVVIGKDLFVYYGAADQVIGVASVRLKELLDELCCEL